MVSDLTHQLGEWEIRVRVENPTIRSTLAHYLAYLEGPFPVAPQATLRFVFEVGEPDELAANDGVRGALGYRFRRHRGELLVTHCHASGIARPEEGTARFRVSKAAIDDRELARDLLSITLSEMLRCRGLYPIHAALAEHSGAGVLVIGQTGAGKSTLALGMAEVGMGVLTDDWALLEEESDRGHILGRALVRTASLPMDQVLPGKAYEELERREDGSLHKIVVTRESLRAPRALRVPLRLVVLATRMASAVSEVVSPRQADALGRALGQSPLVTADRAGFARQSAVLGRLVAECPLAEFRGGYDVARDPARGGHLILRSLLKAAGSR